jgi:hypothetical protein
MSAKLLTEQMFSNLYKPLISSFNGTRLSLCVYKALGSNSV